jgi:hypothetical protein
VPGQSPCGIGAFGENVSFPRLTFVADVAVALFESEKTDVSAKMPTSAIFLSMGSPWCLWVVVERTRVTG